MHVLEETVTYELSMHALKEAVKETVAYLKVATQQ
jgi:hypothetical protein